MAADALAHLHPDDLSKVTSGVLEGIRGEMRALFEASARPPAPLPPHGRPPADLDSLDARQIERLKAEIVESVGKAIHQETSEFLPEDEIEKRIDRVTDKVRDVVQEEITKFRRELYELFEDIGLPLERGEGKRAKTQERIRGMIAIVDGSKEFKKEAFAQIVKAFGLWFAGLIAVGLGVIGIKIGSGH